MNFLKAQKSNSKRDQINAAALIHLKNKLYFTAYVSEALKPEEIIGFPA